MDLGTHESRAIPIGLLDDPATPSRSEMDDTKLAELTDSIRQIGIISHLIVFPLGQRYEVRAGHRRLMAARLVGLAIVPCDVYPSADAADDAVQFAENEYREKLSPADEALWFRELLELKCDGSVDRLCARLRLKRDRVERRLDLVIRGDADVFRALQQQRIKVGVAEVINRCSDVDSRRYMLDLAIHEEWTVARATGALEQWRLYMAPAKAGGAVAIESTDAPLPTVDYFQCLACHKNDNPQNMRAMQLHDYCLRAVVAPALELFGRQSDYVKFPSTLDEARGLAARLIDRFPELSPE